MEANALVAAGEGQSAYEGDEMVVPVMSETSAVLLLVGLFLAAMTPLTLLPLFLRDSQGRRRVGVITAVSILAAGVSTLVAVFVGMKWNSMGDYGEMVHSGIALLYAMTRLPENIILWMDSGEGLRFIFQVLFSCVSCIFLCSWILPVLQKGASFFHTQTQGTDNKSVSPEDVAALRLRQQEELDKRAQESAQKKKELLQQRRLMRIAEHNQKFQSSGHGAGRYAR
ncbi:unnamed protein product [Sphagnum jensenii]|uniref:Uncharacterized protein n=1 Tax=Sphagnum jensenii TaxID=128206 RepID=A0ABP1AD44_9BRYO